MEKPFPEQRLFANQPGWPVHRDDLRYADPALGAG